MLGPPKPRRLDEPIAVSLEELVPQDHFCRDLEAKLDLNFVGQWTRELYAERGRPSIDPVVFFKLQLVMFFKGIRQEQKLIETARLNVTHRWYVGYTRNEPFSGHSSWSRQRGLAWPSITGSRGRCRRGKDSQSTACFVAALGCRTVAR